MLLRVANSIVSLHHAPFFLAKSSLVDQARSHMLCCVWPGAAADALGALGALVQI